MFSSFQKLFSEEEDESLSITSSSSTTPVTTSSTLQDEERGRTKKIQTILRCIVNFGFKFYHFWMLSLVSLHILYPLFLPVAPPIRQLSIQKLLDNLEEYFPVFDDTYYHLQMSSRTTGNLQESVPTPGTLRPESLVVAILRHFRAHPLEQLVHVKKLLQMGINPDGITLDGPSWITPLVAAEIYCSSSSHRDTVQSMLLLYNADINETGWCGKNVLHYRIHQYCIHRDVERLISLLLWINLPMVKGDVPVFSWYPRVECTSIVDYTESLMTNIEEPEKTTTWITLLEILYAFGTSLREEDVALLPNLENLLDPDTYYTYSITTSTPPKIQTGFVFFRERIAHFLQLSWNQMSTDEWKKLFELMSLWAASSSDFENFFGSLWDPVERHRKDLLLQGSQNHFTVDSIEFNGPERFPSSWNIHIKMPGNRSYSVWGGYLQVLFSHPILPPTGESIDMKERKRLWDTYLSGKKLLMFWKYEFVLPENLSSVFSSFREKNRHEVENFPHRIRQLFLQCPVEHFLSKAQDREERTNESVRYMLDRICQWIRKVHPYSNFHQLMDSRKRKSVLFWRYLMQVLSFIPFSSISSISPATSSIISLVPFQRWVTENTGHNPCSTNSLRILLEEVEQDPLSSIPRNDPSNQERFTFPSVLFSPTLLSTTSIPATPKPPSPPILTMDLYELQFAFMKCVYLCCRENLDALHFRFEEEWSILDFFIRSQTNYGNEKIIEQNDEYFSELMSFFTEHSENYPHTTFSILHKKISSLLRIFPNNIFRPPRPSRNVPSSS
jgi:hypothetical protein